MFSNRRGRLNLRLAAIFSSVFLAGTALLFAATFFSLYNSLRQDDLGSIRARLLGFWAQYQAGGIQLVAQEIQAASLLMGERPYLVRIADSDNNTLFQAAPPAWESFNLARLAEGDPLMKGDLVVLDSPRLRYHLEVAGIKLSDQYSLQVGVSTENRDVILDLFRRSFILITVVVVGLSFLAGLFISSRTFKPVGDLNRTIRSIISTGRTDERIPVRDARGELDELVVHFNQMLDRIDTLIREMRGSLDAVAHDLRTPMTRLRGAAELALNGNDEPAAYRDALEKTITEADEILRMLNTLMDISEAESGVMRLRREAVPVVAIVDDMIDLYSFAAEEKRVTLEKIDAEPISISADPVRLKQVVANLIDNAVKYTPEGGTVRVAVRRTDSTGEIVVSDTGIGIAPEELPRIWNRLYRANALPAVPGLGLGLSLVKAIVEAHQGRVTVESEPGNGTTVTVHLPLTA